MEAIKNVITQLMHGLQAKRNGDLRQDPEKLLKGILYKRELRHIKFHYLKKGVLSIKVDSSSWLYYMHIHKEELLSKLAKELPEIKDIRFHIGEILKEPEYGQKSKKNRTYKKGSKTSAG